MRVDLLNLGYEDFNRLVGYQIRLFSIFMDYSSNDVDIVSLTIYWSLKDERGILLLLEVCHYVLCSYLFAKHTL